MPANIDHEILAEYKQTIFRLFPALPRHAVERWSISEIDALALQRFLELYRIGPAVVLDIGTFVGVSAFHLAGHSKVSEVISIDLNPTFAEMEKWGIAVGEGPLRNTQVLDVAGTALARFPERAQKVQFREGTLMSLGVPVPQDGASLVAFVDGDHAKHAVEADLQAIYGAAPRAVAVLHDCLGGHAPSILGGIAAFATSSRSSYRFRLFETLGPKQKRPKLGILYPEAMAGEVERNTAGLLADPETSFFEVATSSFDAWDRQRKRAYRQEKLAKRQRKRVRRLEAELLKVRQPWWRRLLGGEWEDAR